MPNTYTQIYIHVVFAVKGRANLIHPKWEEELYKYICGIVNGKNQKVYAINGMPDHIHILISMRPDISLSDLVRDIKCNSSKWVNANRFLINKFQWQEGFGAFSCANWNLDIIINYINKQKEHHGSRSFKNEYMELLSEYEIEFNNEYLFEWNE